MPPARRFRAPEPKPKPPLVAIRESARFIRRALELVWRSSPSLTIALALLTVVASFMPPAVAWAGKRIVDAVVGGDRDLTLRWVLLELGLVVGQAALMRGGGLVRTILGSRLGTDINVAILDRATKLDLRHFEDPAFYDKLTRARREASSRPLALVTDTLGLVQNVLTLGGFAVLLVRFSAWVVVALMVATIPATIAEMRFSKAGFRLRNWRSPDSRRLMYLEHVLANDAHVKEVKLFGLASLFLGRYKTLSERFHQEDARLSIRRAVVIFVLSLLGTLTFYGSYAVMAVLTAIGRLTLGNMTMYVMAFRSGQQSFQSILSGIGSIYEHNLYMSNLIAYLDDDLDALEPPAALDPAVANAPSALAPPAVSTAPPPSTLDPSERGIRLEDVSFRYPGQDKWVLRNVDLFIPDGQSVALVGQNGAGKTTFVKLLTRLYRPTEGRIAIDGIDLRDWDHAALLARFGVVFQDFNRYQLKVRENVGVGSVEHLEEDARIARSIDRGGAEAVVAQLPSGLDTSLGRWFDDGLELSGGQWQKIALARGFMREEAKILVLDEPTSALDAEAEHAVFERFKELAEGRTTIIISHRFPTVRMADRILVLEGGHVIEDGNHDTLLAADKTYARLYRMQAQGYL